ncbi:MAG: hypothetical protein V4550_04420 [Gemmatimonadota bacterium]
MAERIVTDSAGRAWECVATHDGLGRSVSSQGRDMTLTCSTSSVAVPVSITVGWQWESMAANGLARLILQASPVPR